MSPTSGSGRFELTIRLWSTGECTFDDYIAGLVDLLPRHRGRFARRVTPVGEPGEGADAVLVLSFDDAASIDGFLKDPLRADLDELARTGVRRSLVVDGRERPSTVVPVDALGKVVEFPRPDPSKDDR